MLPPGVLPPVRRRTADHTGAIGIADRRQIVPVVDRPSAAKVLAVRLLTRVTRPAADWSNGLVDAAGDVDADCRALHEIESAAGETNRPLPRPCCSRPRTVPLPMVTPPPNVVAAGYRQRSAGIGHAAAAAGDRAGDGRSARTVERQNVAIGR